MSPRRLLPMEITGFLLRHPVVATQVAETESVMHLGLYDYDYNPATEWRFPGVIPPWGMQVEDSSYGLVTIFPGRDGNWYYTAFSNDLNTDNPDFESPLNCEESGMVEIAGVCVPKPPSLGSIGMFVLIGLGIFAYVSSKRKG